MSEARYANTSFVGLELVVELNDCDTMCYREAPQFAERTTQARYPESGLMFDPLKIVSCRANLVGCT